MTLRLNYWHKQILKFLHMVLYMNISREGHRIFSCRGYKSTETVSQLRSCLSFFHKDSRKMCLKISPSCISDKKWWHKLEFTGIAKCFNKAVNKKDSLPKFSWCQFPEISKIHSIQELYVFLFNFTWRAFNWSLRNKLPSSESSHPLGPVTRGTQFGFSAMLHN